MGPIHRGTTSGRPHLGWCSLKRLRSFGRWRKQISGTSALGSWPITLTTSETWNSQVGTGAAVRTHGHVQKARVRNIEKTQQLSFIIQGNSYLRIHQLLIDLNVKRNLLAKWVDLPPKLLLRMILRNQSLSLFMVMGVKPRTMSMPGKGSVPGLPLQPLS